MMLALYYNIKIIHYIDVPESFRDTGVAMHSFQRLNFFWLYWPIQPNKLQSAGALSEYFSDPFKLNLVSVFFSE